MYVILIKLKYGGIVMIRILALSNEGELIKNLPLYQLSTENLKWYWVDFESPTEEEVQLLKTHFQFHPLAIEDCLHFLQRPKLDYYDYYNFYVLHTLNQETLLSEEIDVFLGGNFMVTFHLASTPEVELVQEKLQADPSHLSKGVIYVFYLLLDKIVDNFFPSIYQIEDNVSDFEMKEADKDIIEEMFEIRNQLLKLRRTVFPMRELLYRVLNSERVSIPAEERLYFMDIYDHLLKLSDMLESNREMTNDIRDSYISLNSFRMNNIMKTLTVMTSIFIPLTFIASIYGMNFEHMPELAWQWSYFAVLGVMATVGTCMVIFLWRKGWFK